MKEKGFKHFHTDGLEVYFDNAATTKPFESVRTAMLNVMEKDYANPSSLHRKGWEAEQRVAGARETIAESIKCDAKEILITSGGTEANNLALMGAAKAKKREGRHIVTTRIEHPSVYEPIRRLEEDGFEVTYLSVDANGRVDMDELYHAIREDTVLLSIMAVNNEIGAVQDWEAITKLAKGKNENVTIHMDGIQAYGKYLIFPKRIGIDLFTASAHKIHGPKGVGFLYKNGGVRLTPILFGGGQEGDLRSGTENVPGIVGMGEAVREIYKNYEEKNQRLYQIKERLLKGLLDIPGVTVNAMDGITIKETAPHIISVSFEGLKSEVLLHALEEKGVYVSSGSACASNHPTTSPTLQAIGVKRERLDTTLRLSHSVYTNEEEVDYVLQVLRELVPVLSRYRRR